jgi:Fur family iron response transcriptional regulator|tara:strand:+ start:307 stop:741 length:435 start_codon:yes stop_codon:yes gene_type:complete
MDEFKIHTERLRASGLRPTRQRLAICKILFDRKETFHFTIEKLKKTIDKNNKKKISLATLYNTVHAFKKNGYLKEISLKGNKTFFDTNTKNHHHFYDEELSQLIDIKNENISLKNLPKAPNGKKIKEIEITIKVANNNQNQKNY